MHTNAAISDSTTRTIPPAAAVLLILAALLFLFAWRLLQVSPDPDRSATSDRTTYQAHRHQSISVDAAYLAGAPEPPRNLLPQPTTAQSREEAWN